MKPTEIKTYKFDFKAWDGAPFSLTVAGDDEQDAREKLVITLKSALDKLEKESL